MGADGLEPPMSLSSVASSYRRALILDQPDRDAIASRLLRYGDAKGSGWADVIDTLTIVDARRRVVRIFALLGDLRD